MHSRAIAISFYDSDRNELALYWLGPLRREQHPGAAVSRLIQVPNAKPTRQFFGSVFLARPEERISMTISLLKALNKACPSVHGLPIFCRICSFD